MMSLAVHVLITLSLVTNIVTGFRPAGNREIALTFDACETKTPAFFDEQLVSYLIENKIPATLFLSGRFIERNRERVRELIRHDFLEIENHSFGHGKFKGMAVDVAIEDVKANERLIAELTGRTPVYFRFPYGEYDDWALRAVKSAGYEVVHWTFASGDPDKKMTAARLTENVLRQARSGAILIFHINGRGWKTAEAMPGIIEGLRSRGYRFVLLRDVLGRGEER